MSSSFQSLPYSLSSQDEVPYPEWPPRAYSFPDHRIKPCLDDPSKTPLALVACGSFSPITILHLRMFEMALDYSVGTEFEVVAGYMSPVADSYKKAGLALSRHRVRMCCIATEQTSEWVMTDAWEALQPQYTPTARVMEHFDHELNTVRNGMPVSSYPNAERKKIRIVLLAGSDLIQTMSEPGVWSPDDLACILGEPRGAFIVERQGAVVDDNLLEPLKQWRDSIHIIRQQVQNDVSSTLVRLSLGHGWSVRYLTPQQVYDYILANDLYDVNANPRAATPMSHAQSSSNSSSPEKAEKQDGETSST